jgi:hypothetical protein
MQGRACGQGPLLMNGSRLHNPPLPGLRILRYRVGRGRVQMPRAGMPGSRTKPWVGGGGDALRSKRHPRLCAVPLGRKAVT